MTCRKSKPGLVGGAMLTNTLIANPRLQPANVIMEPEIVAARLFGCEILKKQ
jgi:hypothetical protein